MAMELPELHGHGTPRHGHGPDLAMELPPSMAMELPPFMAMELPLSWPWNSPFHGHGTPMAMNSLMAMELPPFMAMELPFHGHGTPPSMAKELPFMAMELPFHGHGTPLLNPSGPLRRKFYLLLLLPGRAQHRPERQVHWGGECKGRSSVQTLYSRVCKNVLQSLTELQ